MAGNILRVVAIVLAWVAITYAGLLLGLRALNSGDLLVVVLCGGVLILSLLLLAVIWRLLGQSLL